MTQQEYDAHPGVRYGRWVVRWRIPIVLVSLVVAIGVASGAQHLAFNNSYRVFFGPDNPQLLAFDELENVYNKNDNVIFGLEPKDGDVFTPEMMRIIADLTDEAWTMPYARRVDSLTNFQHSRAEGDELIVEDLVPDPYNVTQEELERAREIALREPVLVNRVIPQDTDITAVAVTVEFTGEDPKETTIVSQRAREMVAQLEEKYPDLNVYLSGVVLLNNAFAEGAENDLKVLTNIMYLAMVIVMVVLLRSILSTLATLLVIGLSMGMAMGMAGWLGIELTPPSSIAPIMVLTLAIADSIHVLVSMYAAMRDGMPRRDAIVESLRVNLNPVLVTSITTAIGFASLNLSDAPPFRDLGNMAAMGVLFAYVLSVTFLPALVAILPIRPPQKRQPGNWGLERFSDFIVRRQKPVLVISATVVVGLASFILANEPNDLFVEYFDESVDFRADSDYLLDNLTGLYQIDFSLGTGETNGISDPGYLAAMDAFEAWWRQQPDVLQVNSLSHTMKKLNQNMYGDDPAMFRLPENRELAAQYLLLYEMSLPFGLDLNNQINVDKSSTRFSVLVDNVSSGRMREMAEQGEQWLAANAPESMFSHGIGPPLMFAHISHRNFQSMVKGTLLAFGFISLTLIVALKSVKYGIFSLIPNMVPAAMAFGVWGLLVGRVDLGLSIVASISLGIVVDDTVHFLSKYIRARREKGLDAEDAVRYAFATVGRALIVTSAVLVIGFLVMTRSTFSMNANMGWFTAMTIFFAVAADFFLLPALLIQIDRARRPKEPAAAKEPALASA